MVIRDIYNETRDFLGNPREAEMIVSKVLGLTKLDFMLKGKEPVSPEQIETIRGYAQRRKAREPLQYILGSQEFMSLKFKVCPGVLIPRGDTETLVETMLKRCRGDEHILEIGTGSGCIAVSLAYYCPEVRITAVDISEIARRTARENAVYHHVEDRVIIEACNIMEEVPAGRFDMIVSNPPYIERKVIPCLEPDVRDHEPVVALDGGEDGLDFYRRIAAAAPSLLNAGGGLWLEVGFDQAERVAQLLRQQGFAEIETIKDLCGIERVVGGTWGVCDPN